MTARRRNRRGRRRGFSLMEAIATIVILAIVGSLTSGLIVNASDGYMAATTRAQLQSEMAVAMDRMIREIRKIPLDGGAAGVAPDIDALFPTYVQWNATQNLISFTAGQIRVTMNGGTARTLLDDVTACDFAAFNESNGVLGLPLSDTGCDPIRRIEITLTCVREGVTVTLRTRVFVRSTMSGGEA